MGELGLRKKAAKKMVYVFFLRDPLLFWLDSIRQNEVTDRRSWEAYVKEKMEQVPIIDAKKSTLCKKENNLHKKMSHKTEQKSQQVCFFFQESGVWNIEMF